MTYQNKPVDDYGASSSFAFNAQSQAGSDQNSPQDQLDALNQRIQSLEQKKINLNTDLFGLFEVVSAVPAGAPKIPYDQIKIYTNGSTYRLYWYDPVNNAWRYATGT
jgi:hypothetical protein